MTHLEQISIQQYCEVAHQYFLSIDPSTTETDDEIQSSRTDYLHSVLRMCEKYLLERLHVSVLFLLESGSPLHLMEDKPIIRPSNGVLNSAVTAVTMGGVLDYDSPTALRKAISESVHDVTSLLNSDEDDPHGGGGKGRRGRGGTQPYESFPDESDITPYAVPGTGAGVGSRKTSSSSSQKKLSTTTSKAMPRKTSTGGSQVPRKGSKGASGGGIYKLLLQESSSAHQNSTGHGFAMGTEVDPSILDTSSQDDIPEYHEPDLGADGFGYSYEPESTGPILMNANHHSSSSGSAPSAGARKGKTLNVEEFIQTQHSLAPPANKKLTPAQKRS
jgi:hypothetical protein